MTFAQKLALANFATAILIASISATVTYVGSYNYCHGSSHNARGWYCETVYQNEDGYRALR